MKVIVKSIDATQPGSVVLNRMGSSFSNLMSNGDGTAKVVILWPTASEWISQEEIDENDFTLDYDWVVITPGDPDGYYWDGVFSIDMSLSVILPNGNVALMVLA